MKEIYHLPTTYQPKFVELPQYSVLMDRSPAWPTFVTSLALCSLIKHTPRCGTLIQKRPKA